MVERISEKVKPQFKIVEIDEETKALALKLTDEAMNKSPDNFTRNEFNTDKVCHYTGYSQLHKIQIRRAGKGIQLACHCGYAHYSGRNFGATVSFEKKNCIYFYLGQKGFLIFKTVNNLFSQVNKNIRHS